MQARERWIPNRKRRRRREGDGEPAMGQVHRRTTLHRKSACARGQAGEWLNRTEAVRASEWEVYENCIAAACGLFLSLPLDFNSTPRRFSPCSSTLVLQLLVT